MKAIILEAINTPLTVTELPKPEAKSGETLVRVNYAALNHRDVWITKGQYAAIVTPIVLGSDCCGTDEAGNEVIINPVLILAMTHGHNRRGFRCWACPINGTLAEYVCVESKYVFPKPAHLSAEQATALPLAGVTAYRALFVRGGIQTRRTRIGIRASAAVWPCLRCSTPGLADRRFGSPLF